MHRDIANTATAVLKLHDAAKRIRTMVTSWSVELPLETERKLSPIVGYMTRAHIDAFKLFQKAERYHNSNSGSTLWTTGSLKTLGMILTMIETDIIEPWRNVNARARLVQRWKEDDPCIAIAKRLDAWSVDCDCLTKEIYEVFKRYDRKNKQATIHGHKQSKRLNSRPSAG